MRKLILTIALLLVAIPAMADVTAEIIARELDDNGNIIVWTQYKIDGVEVVSRYPKIDGKYVYATRYSAHNFGDMTKAQIEQKIIADIQDNINALGREEFSKKKNLEILSTKLDGLIGKTAAATEHTIEVDNDGDGKMDKRWRVKTDGTKVSESIITPAP